MKNVTFEHVKGVEEAKNELQDVVEFLKNPQKFTALGGKLPKGRVVSVYFKLKEKLNELQQVYNILSSDMVTGQYFSRFLSLYFRCSTYRPSRDW